MNAPDRRLAYAYCVLLLALFLGPSDFVLAQAGDGEGSPEQSGTEPSARDAGAADAGARDAGSRDAGAADAGARDAGSRDAGAADAGVRDAAVRDAGVLDAGGAAPNGADGGSRDAGVRDGGAAQTDAGARDAAVRDAGAAHPAHDGGSPHRGHGDAEVASPYVPVPTSLDSGIPDAGLVEDDLLDGGVDEAGISDAAIEVLGDAGLGDAAVDPLANPAPPPIELRESLEEAIGVPGATNTVVRTLLGLVLLLAIAYLASHRKVQQFERVIGISQVVTAGFPFVALGLLARAPGIELMTAESVAAITPILQFGLGWIGFRTGFEFDYRTIDKLPKGTMQVMTLVAFVPFVVISVAAAGTLLLLGWASDTDKVLRNAALLGAAGAMTSPTIARVLRIRGFADEDVELARSVGLLDDLAGVLGLMFVSTLARTPVDGSTWDLPGAGWILVTLGLAVVLGIVVHITLRAAERGADRAALLIGSVAFSSGLAGVLQLSPLVVCFFAAIILRNIRREGDPLGPVFTRFERPIYLVFLAVAGALWEIDDYRGWVLVPVLVISRIVGRYLGLRAARRIELDSHESKLVREADTGLLVAPMGSLAIALVMSAQTLYVSRYVPLFVTAVIGGSIVLEILVQASARVRNGAVDLTHGNEP